ncbi:MAG: hypothetical protein AAF478_13220 [Pseudomonadota bacterium]
MTKEEERASEAIKEEFLGLANRDIEWAASLMALYIHRMRNKPGFNRGEQS